jgi:hypothetical protein
MHPVLLRAVGVCVGNLQNYFLSFFPLTKEGLFFSLRRVNTGRLFSHEQQDTKQSILLAPQTSVHSPTFALNNGKTTLI